MLVMDRIRDPGSGENLSRIQGSKEHRIRSTAIIQTCYNLLFLFCIFKWVRLLEEERYLDHTWHLVLRIRTFSRRIRI
jgi:hypothetical protein